MRQLKTDIIIFIGVLVFTSIVLLLTIGQTTIDIQLHDTYLVLDKPSLAILIIGPMTFLIFLTRGLAKKFRTKGTNIGLIIGLILVAVITFYIIRLQQSYMSEMKTLDDERMPDRGQFGVDTKNRINWTWGLLYFWITGVLLLTLKTIKIWKERYNS